jgi:hypothetical protein
MLITATHEELKELLKSILVLPSEGKELNEFISREFSRNATKLKLSDYLSALQGAPLTITSQLLLDDYWAIRLGMKPHTD